MLDTALALLAAKAKTVALVAGTAAVTAGAVGGGTVALQAVSDSSDLPVAAASAASSATPTAGIGRQGRGRGAENRSDTATAVLTGASPAAEVAFTCDPARSHGQNVSAYVHSLPKGPGRGQQVSQAARSDCGKDAPEAEAAEPSERAEPGKRAKPEKAEKPGKPEKPGKAPKGKGKD